MMGLCIMTMETCKLNIITISAIETGNRMVASASSECVSIITGTCELEADIEVVDLTED